MTTSPINPTDDEARGLARTLLTSATHAALGVLDPDTGAPSVTRIAIGTDDAGLPVTLISTLARHTVALRSDPRASLLIGEPGPKGDPLTHPRITLACTARFIDRMTPDHATLRTRWLTTHPKAKLYVDFADFGFVRFNITSALLNGGFGKAYALTAQDLEASPGAD